MNEFAKQAAYQGSIGSPTTAAAPLTVASALGRMDTVNQRLLKLREQMNHVADLLGGPRPTNGQLAQEAIPPNGAVQTLNYVADKSNSIISDIEDTMNCVLRSLG